MLVLQAKDSKMEDASEGLESEGPVPMEAEPASAAAKGKRKVKKTEVPFTASQVRPWLMHH